MHSLDFLIWLEQLRNPATNALFLAASVLGTEQVYMAILMTVYLCVNHRFGFHLMAVFLVSAWANAELKWLFGTMRPFEMYPDQLHPMFTRGAEGNAFPSGHAQNATVVWGMLAMRARSRRVQIGLVALIAVIMFSRLFLQVHWPLDLLGGLLVGVGMLGIYLLVVKAWLAGRLRLGSAEWGLLLLTGTALMLAFGYQDATCMRAAGAFFGTSLGFWLLDRRGYDPTGAPAVQVMKVTGTVVTLLILKRVCMGLMGELPYGTPLVYATTGFIGAFVIPVIITTLRARTQSAAKAA